MIDHIPLTKLTLSKANVRRGPGDAAADAQLEASIRALGVLHNLVVVPNGNPGTFEVVAGARRLRALQRIHGPEAEVSVPCEVLAKGDGVEASLAENVARLDMHPLDACEAFGRLVKAGKDTAEIAARFGVSERYVEHRLRLAGLHQEIKKALRDAETRMLAAERRGRGELDPLVGPRTASRILDHAEAQAQRSDFAWNTSQRMAASILLTSRDRVAALQGYAGTAKTTTVLATIASAAAARGYGVTAVAPTTTAARTLAEQIGAEPRTLQGLLVDLQRQRAERVTSSPTRSEVWIVDEASLAGTRQLRQLIEAAEHRDARVLLVGDTAQLGSVEAGRAFAQLQQHGMPTAVLDRIVRQSNPNLRAAVYAALGRQAGEALARLDRGGGAIESSLEPEQRLARLAARFTSLPRDERERTLVLEPSRDGRHALNGMIRSGLQAMGELGANGLLFSALNPKGLTRTESRLASSYLPGDVVRFIRDVKIAPGVRVAPADYLTVAAADGIDNRVVLRHADGSAIPWNPSRGGASAQVFEPRSLPVASGDRVVWTLNQRAMGRVNGETATVVAVDRRRAEVTVELRNGERQILKPALRPEDRHIDHGYVQTAHKAQGATADRVLAHLDSRRLNLVNRQSFYVAISRARTEATVVTDDATRLRAALASRSGEVTSALDAANLTGELQNLRAAVREQGRAGSEPGITAPRPAIRIGAKAPVEERQADEAKERRHDRDRGL